MSKVLSKSTSLFVFLCLHLMAGAQKTDTTGISNLMKEADLLFTTTNASNVQKAWMLYDRADSLYALLGDKSSQLRCKLHKGRCLYQLGKLDEAKNTFMQIIAENPFPSASVVKESLAKAYLDLIEILYSKKEYSEAEKVCKQGCALLFNMKSIDYEFVAEFYDQLKQIAWREKRYTTALSYAQKVVAMYESRNARMERLFNAYISLAQVYGIQGHTDSAFLYLNKLEDWLDTLTLPTSPHINAPYLYTYLSMLYSDTGDEAKALQYALKAVAVAEKNDGKYSNASAYAYTTLSLQEIESKLNDKSLEHGQIAVQILDSLYHKPVSLTVWTWCNMGSTYLSIQDTVQAKIYWEKALAGAELLGDLRTIMATYEALGNYCEQKGQYKEALSYYEKIIAILYEEEMTSDANLIRLYGLSANLLNRLNRYDEALEYIEKALTRQCFTGNCFQNADRLPKPVELRGVQSLLYNLKEKGVTLLGKWRTQPNNSHLLDAAWQSAEQTLRAADFFRKQYQGSGKENYDWLKYNHATYAFAVEVALQKAAQQGHATEFLQNAFQIADKSRAIVMAEGIRQAEARTFAGIPNELLVQERQLRTQIAAREEESQTANKTESSSDNIYSDSILFNLHRTQARLMARLEHEYPHYYNLVYNNKPLDVAQLRQALPKDAALIEYMINEKEKALYIFVVDREQGIRLHIGRWNNINTQQVLQLQQRAQSLLVQRNVQRDQFIVESYELYQRLIQPIKPYLEGKKQLLIVAEGDLHYLPFEILIESPESKPFDQLSYLLRRYEISYQYAAALYLHNVSANKPTFKNAIATGQILAFAPVFGSQSDPQAIALRNLGTIDTTLRAATADGIHFKPLPYSEQEVRTIADMFGKQHTNVLLRQDANEASLKAVLEQPYRVIHLSTHSFANKNRPKFSGIVCTQPMEQSPDIENGILYANEIYNLSLVADLVVLSSCESGLGKSGGGEGLLGLNRAFAYAGVPNVVYSLWKVSDKATSELMVAFYKEMLAGKTYAAALRAAKLKMLENPITASPNFWSGFLLMGQ